MKFIFEFKFGPKTIAKIEGKELNSECVTLAELEQVVPLEQKLDKMLGLRVHITMVGEWTREKASENGTIL